ncbi:MAG: hypothetical protein ABUK13_09120 [Gammaproteobacteria bacterium]
MNFILRCIAIAVMVAPVSALANTWSCTHNKLIRTVSIESEAGSTACAVNYTKETEGVPMKTLWNAANDTAYCQEKAEAFVAKLTSWGWNCTAPEAAPVSAPEAAAEPAAPVAPAAATAQ